MIHRHVENYKFSCRYPVYASSLLNYVQRPFCFFVQGPIKGLWIFDLRRCQLMQINSGSILYIVNITKGLDVYVQTFKNKSKFLGLKAILMGEISFQIKA